MNCLICDSPSTEFFGIAPLRYKDLNAVKAGDFPILECRVCGSLMLDSSEGLGLLHSAAEYWTDPLNAQDFLVRRKPVYCQLLKRLNGLKCPNRHIIDFGCSYGHFTKLLKDNGWNPVGVEALKITRECAARNYPDIRFYENVEHVPPLEGGYGCVVAIDSFYYVDNAGETLKAMTKKMSDASILFMRNFNRAQLCKIEKRALGFREFRHFGSARFHFSKKGIETLLKQFNFGDIKWSYWEFYRRKMGISELLYTYPTRMAAVLTGGALLLSPAFIVSARLRNRRC